MDHRSPPNFPSFNGQGAPIIGKYQQERSVLYQALQRCAMKSLRYVASAMLAAGMMAGQPAAFATDSPPIQVAQPSNDLPAATLPTDSRLPDAISAIERAPDPSSATHAYV